MMQNIVFIKGFPLVFFKKSYFYRCIMIGIGARFILIEASSPLPSKLNDLFGALSL